MWFLLNMILTMHFHWLPFYIISQLLPIQNLKMYFNIDLSSSAKYNKIFVLFFSPRPGYLGFNTCDYCALLVSYITTRTFKLIYIGQFRVNLL